MSYNAKIVTLCPEIFCPGTVWLDAAGQWSYHFFHILWSLLRQMGRRIRVDWRWGLRCSFSNLFRVFFNYLHIAFCCFFWMHPARLKLQFTQLTHKSICIRLLRHNVVINNQLSDLVDWWNIFATGDKTITKYIIWNIKTPLRDSWNNSNGMNHVKRAYIVSY